jgi:hypothetical protein
LSQVYKLATSPLRVAMKLLEQEDQFSRFREHDELYQKLLQSTSVLFVAESETEKGMPCLARIRVLSGLSSFLMGMDELDGEPVPQRIIITVWEQGWETLEEDQRAANCATFERSSWRASGDSRWSGTTSRSSTRWSSDSASGCRTSTSSLNPADLARRACSA